MGYFTKNQWMAMIFAVFLLTVGGYGGCYNAIYVSAPTSFYFQESVALEQERQALAAARNRLEALTRQEQLLARLEGELAAGRLPEVTGRTLIDKAILTSVLSTADAQYEFSVALRLMPPPYAEEGRRIPYPSLTVYDAASAKEVGRWTSDETGILSGTVADYSALTRRFRESVGKEVEASKAMQQLVAGGQRHWSNWDFLYFSVITACTVGYGDILPNRTLVRLLVVSQVVLSSFLLVVVINIVLRPKGGRGGAASSHG